MRIRSESTITDHRVVRIGQYIQHRCEVESDADAPQFLSHRLAYPASECRRASLAQAGGRWKVRKRRSEAVDSASFMVKGNEQGMRRKQGVKLGAESGKRIRIGIITAKKDYAAWIQVAEQPARFLV